MSLDGLRAWIGEVERKLGMRTRVFLVLAVIALGGAGAAIYLAIDARNSSVSESDVRELQQQLEAQIGGGGATEGGGEAQLEAELKALQAQVEQLEAEGGSSGKGTGTSESGPSDGASAPSNDSSAKQGGLLRQAKEAPEKAEGK